MRRLEDGKLGVGYSCFRIISELLFSDEAWRRLPGETSNKNVENNIFVIFTGRTSE